MEQKIGLRHKIIRSALYCVSGVAIVFGCFYIATPRLMPYHEAYLHLQTRQMEPALRVFVLGQLHLIGCCFVALGATLALLAKPTLKIPALRRQIVAVFIGCVLFPLQYFTLKVGHHSPWWLVALLISVSALGAL